jgi:hypothetical protein
MDAVSSLCIVCLIAPDLFKITSLELSPAYTHACMHTCFETNLHRVCIIAYRIIQPACSAANVTVTRSIDLPNSTLDFDSDPHPIDSPQPLQPIANLTDRLAMNEDGVIGALRLAPFVSWVTGGRSFEDCPAHCLG